MPASPSSADLTEASCFRKVVIAPDNISHLCRNLRPQDYELVQGMFHAAGEDEPELSFAMFRRMMVSLSAAPSITNG